jgi:nitrous oxidase accessory protein NosD
MSLVLAIALSFSAPQLPEVIVRDDDTRITRSCRITIPDGLVIADADGDGVIHIEGDRLRIVFTPGSILRGAPMGTPGDQLKGIGIRADHCRDLILEGVRVEGYRCGAYLSHVDGLRMAQAEFRNNFRQHLRSTLDTEDGADWLWPHDNDEEQWRKNYGAAVYVSRSRDVELRDIYVREQQNGIILDRVDHGRVYDNNCSFLSGWGLAMWRSNHNVISRNAFDFCVRGYSHGVYNRGQDSAGILMFEQCSNNIFVENSATHGGDGLFSFAGKEALGEADPMPDGFQNRRAGCNDNLFVGNDFSYAVAHGLEITFSFGNRMLNNRFVGNAICGIWGGFSQDTLIEGNSFEANGDRGYGLERGGINIDRSRNNRILGNQFRDNACGIHLWSLPTGFLEKPWGKANNLEASGNQITGNQFHGDTTAVHLRGDVVVEQWNNQGLPSVGEALRLEGDASVRWPRDGISMEYPAFQPTVFGKRKPVGARAGLAGRENIVVTEWGPWDHTSPLVRMIKRDGDRHLYKIEPAGTVARIIAANPRGTGRVYGEAGSGYLEVKAPGPGQFRYSIDLDVGGARRTVSGEMLVADWQVAWFATPFDPRDEPAAWQEAAASDSAVRVNLTELRLPYGMGGPRELPINQGREGLPDSEAFGTLATARLPLGPGTWKVWTNSDDGVRVWVDGKAVIDNWTWHGPTRDEGSFRLNTAREVELRVEHFELNGYSILEFGLEKTGS